MAGIPNQAERSFIFIVVPQQKLTIVESNEKSELWEKYSNDNNNKIMTITIIVITIEMILLLIVVIITNNNNNNNNK